MAGAVASTTPELFPRISGEPLEASLEPFERTPFLRAVVPNRRCGAAVFYISEKILNL